MHPTQSDLQAAIKLRGADVYADFLIPHLRPGVTVLDCGCGAGTITLGLAEAVPDGHVIGVDLDLSGLKGRPPRRSLAWTPKPQLDRCRRSLATISRRDIRRSPVSFNAGDAR
jgi:SAM-dependent methyltransferase